MSREQERIRKKLEQNPIVECNRIQRKFYRHYFQSFQGWRIRAIKVILTIPSRLCWELCIISALAEFQVCRKWAVVCRNNGWDYIIRYKEGCAATIEQEYRALPEKEKAGEDIEYQNQIPFGENDVNLIYYTEKKEQADGKIRVTKFAWITNIKITKGNAGKIVLAGRNRWKIENQGFNRQKHWQGNIEHAYSFHEQAQKNHYLMEQIADFIKQLYEYFYLERNGIRKLQKNISSELLASFGRQLTETEDIPAQLNESVLNWDNCSKEGDACQEEIEKLFTFFWKRNKCHLLMWITWKKWKKMWKRTNFLK